jgi:hypothetical protein
MSHVEGVSSRVRPAVEDLDTWVQLMHASIANLTEGQKQLHVARDRVLQNFTESLDAFERKEKKEQAVQMEDIATMLEIMQEEADARAKATLEQA